MRGLKILTMTIIVVLYPCFLLSQSNGNIDLDEKYVIHSDIIGEDQEYWVHLPMNYENSEIEYPVLYITDGDEFFNLASGTTEFMSIEYIIPECIVVGLLHEDRNHALTPTYCETFVNGLQCDAAKVSGGGDTLLQFIQQELIPRIEQNYRTGPYRIFAGHSLGGLLTVYAFLNYNQLFNSFIAMDPALNWDRDFCQRLLHDGTYKSPELSSRLYISSAHNAHMRKKDKSALRLSQDAFKDELQKKKIENFKHEYFEDQNHMTVPYKSLYAGLANSFPDFYILEDPMFRLDTSFLVKFYELQSDIYKMHFQPSQRLIEMFGKYFLYDVDDYYNAIKFFELDTTIYKDSYKAYHYLGKAYKAAEMPDGAVVNLIKALELNPESEDIQVLLEDVLKQ